MNDGVTGIGFLATSKMEKSRDESHSITVDFPFFGWVMSNFDIYPPEI